MSYIENSRGKYTASKLKMLYLCPELFKKLYITEELKEISEEQQDEDALVVGTLFHKFWEEMCEWGDREQKIKDKCYVTNEYLKDDYKQKILERYKFELIKEQKEQPEIDLAMVIEAKRLNKSTMKLSDLQVEYYGEENRAEMQKNIPLTRGQYAMILGMMESTAKQKLWDFGGKYSREAQIFATFNPKGKNWKIELAARPDRFVFIKYENWDEVERYTIEEYDKLVEWMNRNQKKQYVVDNWIKGLLRDFKTIKGKGIAKTKKELMYDQETKFGYVFSMSYYYSIIYVKYGVESDVRIDFVEKTAPYLTEVIRIPDYFLSAKMSELIIPTMKLAVDYEETGIYPAADRAVIMESNELKKYYQYFDNVQQESPRDLDLV